MIRRLSTRTRKRRKQTANSRLNTGDLAPTNVAGSGNDVVFTFDEPLMVSGSPAWEDDNGLTPTSVAQTGTGELTLTYGSAPVAPITVPFQDRSIRGRSGSFVRAGDYTF
jgi:hypothetical protein